MTPELVEVCGGKSDSKKEFYSSAGMYEGGSKSFRPDIQKPRQMKNTARDI